MRINRTTRALGALTLTAALALTAAACGNDDASTATSSEVSSTEHNDADVEFASNMLQHHAQALSMVDLTIDRTLDPEVQQLAEQIREAQAPRLRRSPTGSPTGTRKSPKPCATTSIPVTTWTTWATPWTRRTCPA